MRVKPASLKKLHFEKKLKNHGRFIVEIHFIGESKGIN